MTIDKPTSTGQSTSPTTGSTGSPHTGGAASSPPTTPPVKYMKCIDNVDVPLTCGGIYGILGLQKYKSNYCMPPMLSVEEIRELMGRDTTLATIQQGSGYNSPCMHEKVNVGFTTVKWACKWCGHDM